MQEKLNEKYTLAVQQLEALWDPSYPEISNYANAAAFINSVLPDINWAGFYFTRDKELYLGPFIGLPACVILHYPKGVCWKAVIDRKTVVVDDVHAFPGHIACDSASRSEIVVPIFKNGEVFAVLDIDSPLPARFNEEDAAGITALAKTVEKAIAQ